MELFVIQNGTWEPINNKNVKVNQSLKLKIGGQQKGKCNNQDLKMNN